MSMSGQLMKRMALAVDNVTGLLTETKQAPYNG